MAQFVEQPRVLDGDDGLRGEVRDQRDLLVGERLNFLPEYNDGAAPCIATARKALPSRKYMVPNLASQMRVAFSSMA